MAIFNSLGSNYDFAFVARSLWEEKKNYKSKLEKLLEEKYGGKVLLVYKGREAIRLALRTISMDSHLRGNDSQTPTATRTGTRRRPHAPS